jgi:hypothetical protein
MKKIILISTPLKVSLAGIIVYILSFTAIYSYFSNKIKVLTNSLVLENSLNILVNVFPDCVKSILKKNDLELIAIMQKIKKYHSIAYAIVLDNNGKVLGHNDISQWGKTYNNSLTINALNARHIIIQDYKFANETIYDIGIPVNIGGYRIATIRLGVYPKEINLRIKQIKQQVHLWIFISAVIFMLLLYAITNVTFIQPINNLIKALSVKPSLDTTEKYLKGYGKELQKLYEHLSAVKTNIENQISNVDKKLQQLEIALNTLFTKLKYALGYSVIFIDRENKIRYVDNVIREKLLLPEDILGQHILHIRFSEENKTVMQFLLNTEGNVTKMSYHNEEFISLPLIDDSNNYHGKLIITRVQQQPY